MVSRVFYRLLPDLRARAFTVSGVDDLRVLSRVKERVTELASGAEGKTWDQLRAEIVDDLRPFLDELADARATLVLRSNAYLAFQAATWQVAQADEDTTHLQYMAVHDERTRESHMALDGLVLPKDDPFWETHFPPWEWGCRCQARPINPDLLAEIEADDATRAPDERLIVTGPRLERLRQGQLVRAGQAYDVTPPTQKPGGEREFAWDPGSLKLTVDELRNRFAPEEWAAFERWAKRTEYADGRTVWDWLEGAA